MPTLYGRETERSVLHRLVGELAGGRGGAALLEGEPGIGKTGLLGDACDHARRHGCSVRAAAAEEFASRRPFALFTRALGIDPAEPAPHGRDRTPEGAESALADRVVEAAERLAAAHPLVLACDDLQWADWSSAAVLHRLARSAATTPLLLLLCFRPAPRPPGLARLRRALAAAGAPYLRVGPLTAEDARRMAADLLGGPLDARTRERVDAAGGHPVFVEELVRGPEGSGPVAAGLPASVNEAILARIGLLEDPSLDVLRYAAAFDAPFGLADLALVTGRDVPALLDLLRDPIALGVLTEAGDRYAFRHDLLREAVYGATPRPIRAALHTHIGRVLAEQDRDALTVASHLNRGASPGDPEVVTWLVRASDDTRDHAPGAAAELMERAVAVAGTDSPRRRPLRRRLLHLQVEAGALDEAVGLGESMLAERPPAPEEESVRRAVAEARLWQGRFADAAAMLAPLVAGESNAGSGPGGSLLAAWYAFLQAWLDPTGADPLVDGALSSGATDREARYFALVADASRQMIRGRLSYAADQAAAAGSILLEMHRREQAVRWLPPMKHLCAADRYTEVADRLRHPLWQRGRHQPLRQSILAAMHYTRGEWDDASAAAETAIAAADDLDSAWGSRSDTVCVRGLVAIGRGRLDDAERVAADAAPADLAAQSVAAQLDQALGRRKAAEERIAAARKQLLAEPLSRHLLRDTWTVWLPVCLEAGDHAMAESIAASVAGLADTAGVPSAAAAGLFARGLVAGDPDALTAAVEEYRHTPRIVELAQCREAAGGALAGRGHRDDAREHLRAAAESYERMGAARHAARVDAALRELGVCRGRRGPRRRPETGWESLTATERAVAELVWRGLLYREIGERLFISRRTVETHVLHMFAKLGVNSRRELAEVVRAHTTS
ncbi:AAA family ATPase [Streptomonospora sp. PA3]|uniref:ATP-binding protein n=1 Tax=Streptomonospora sp. PA3 TaxID=2607326 RepID=UPI001642D783|nr:LuxR family transcriptional regulator [Streptomonospora sp. PA3]